MLCVCVLLLLHLYILEMYPGRHCWKEFSYALLYEKRLNNARLNNARLAVEGKRFLVYLGCKFVMVGLPFVSPCLRGMCSCDGRRRHVSRLTALECPSMRMSCAHVWRALPFGRMKGRKAGVHWQCNFAMRWVWVLFMCWRLKPWHCISSWIVHPPLSIFQVTAQSGYAVAGTNRKLHLSSLLVCSRHRGP